MRSGLIMGALVAGLLAVPVGANATSATQPDAGPLAPRDECEGLPGYAEFRRQLDDAITLRDADALLALADESVTLDFGGGMGVLEWRDRLDAGEYQGWSDLAATVNLGCGVSENLDGDAEGAGYIAFPWYFPKPIGEDPFETVIVMGVDVPLRQSPLHDAKILTRISWDWVLVRYDEGDDEETGYWPVATQDGVSGYMSEHTLRSIVDYRLVANRQDGGWKITAFVAGD